MHAFRVHDHDASLRYLDLPGEEDCRETLVFLHGLGAASSFSFPAIASSSALRSYRSILIDLLGYGYSDRPSTFGYTMDDQARLVVGLLEHLKLEDTTLFGHSMGGAIAILATAAAPGRIGRLILAESNLDPKPGIVSGIIARWDEQAFVDSGYTTLLAKMRGIGYADYARTVETADPLAMHRSATDLITDRTPAFRDILYGLSVPCSFLIADENIADPDAKELPRHDIPVSIIENSGHDMMADNPLGFAHAIGRALR